MSLLLERQPPVELGDRLRDACCVTAEFLADIIRASCRRFPSPVQEFRSARSERRIESQAWTDAALALIDLELPQWQVRRLAYDDGEWYCALSRTRDMPDWLDPSGQGPPPEIAPALFSPLVGVAPAALIWRSRFSAPLSRCGSSAPTRSKPACLARRSIPTRAMSRCCAT